jgi:GntR family transcriptional regulator/MocR family aminotransferase
MFNGLRLGYLVVPESLVEALAEFITEGGLLRHIRKMRRLYKTKHEQMSLAIEKYLPARVSVISQAAGLHITLKWQQGIDEHEWTKRAEALGIVLRPMSYYEHPDFQTRDWHGAVLGYGNVALDQIDALIQQVSQLFEESVF